VIDAAAVVKTYLGAQSALTAVIGSRLWAERSDPIPGYTPSQGGAIAFRARGGEIDYTSQILENSWQFKCYGATEYQANQVYRALVDAFHNTHGGAMRRALLEVAGQPLEEPGSEWVYVICFFVTWMKSELPQRI
jgi:hypothetical protein